MDWLNYHHLLYFWTVAREGGLREASDKLRVAPQTLSGQIRRLEEAFGEKLFRKRGRRLELNEVGRVVYGYADDIFTLGQDLQDAVKGRLGGGRLQRLVVGIADVVPKLVAKELLAPIIAPPVAGAGEDAPAPVHLVCKEGNAERLIAELGAHRLDAVLLDAPAPPSAGVRVFNHPLGETEVELFAPARDAARLRAGFPGSLDGAPMLLPTMGAAIRLTLDGWFDRVGVRPRVVAEFDDSALMNVFAQDGLGVFPGSAVFAHDIMAYYGVEPIGRAAGVTERFFVVTLKRRLEHAAVRRLTERARTVLFAPAAS